MGGWKGGEQESDRQVMVKMEVRMMTDKSKPLFCQSPTNRSISTPVDTLRVQHGLHLRVRGGADP